MTLNLLSDINCSPLSRSGIGVLTAKGSLMRSPIGSSGLHTSTESKDNYCLKSGKGSLHPVNECATIRKGNSITAGGAS